MPLLEFGSVSFCSCGELAAHSVLGFSDVLVDIVDIKAAEGGGGRHCAVGGRMPTKEGVRETVVL